MTLFFFWFFGFFLSYHLIGKDVTLRPVFLGGFLGCLWGHKLVRRLLLWFLSNLCRSDKWLAECHMFFRDWGLLWSGSGCLLASLSLLGSVFLTQLGGLLLWCRRLYWSLSFPFSLF